MCGSPTGMPGGDSSRATGRRRSPGPNVPRHHRPDGKAKYPLRVVLSANGRVGGVPTVGFDDEAGDLETGELGDDLATGHPVSATISEMGMGTVPTRGPGPSGLRRPRRGAGPSTSSRSSTSSSRATTGNAPSRSRRFVPPDVGRSMSPGTAKTSLPCSRARRAVTRAPLRIGRLDDDDDADETRDDPVAGGESPRLGRRPRPELRDHRPTPGEDALTECPVGRVGYQTSIPDPRTATALPPPSRHPRWAAASIPAARPLRRPAGGTDERPDVLGDAETVGAGPPRSDDRDSGSPRQPPPDEEPRRGIGRDRSAPRGTLRRRLRRTSPRRPRDGRRSPRREGGTRPPRPWRRARRRRRHAAPVRDGARPPPRGGRGRSQRPPVGEGLGDVGVRDDVLPAEIGDESGRPDAPGRIPFPTAPPPRRHRRAASQPAIPWEGHRGVHRPGPGSAHLSPADDPGRPRPGIEPGRRPRRGYRQADSASPP